MKVRKYGALLGLVAATIMLCSCDLLLMAAIRAAGGSAKEITGFRFSASNNGALGISTDCVGAIAGDTISVTVPFGTERNGLIADFVTTGVVVYVGARSS